MSASPESLRIACIGEAMVELTLDRDNTTSVDLGFAGDSLNTAIYLKRLLGRSHKVSFATVLGLDPLSDRLVDFLHSESLNTDCIRRSSDRLVGLYAITTDNEGERTFSYWRDQSAARTLFQNQDALDFDSLFDFDVLCLSAITLAILPDWVRAALLDTLARLRREQGTTIVFDSNFRPKLWESIEQARLTVADAWRVTDIALPSIDDEMNLFGDTSESAVRARLAEYGITQGALKRGPAGPVSLNSESDNLNIADYLPSSSVKVVDTTAAGDSFNAGYLAAILTGQSELEALLAGHRCAVRVIAHTGAIVPASRWI